MDLIRFTHPSPLRLRDSLSVTPTRDRRGESVLLVVFRIIYLVLVGGPMGLSP